MFKLITILILGASVSLNAQTFSSGSFSFKNNAGQEFENLIASIVSNQESNSLHPDLSDFNAKVQSGLNYMYPGSSVLNLRCVNSADFSLPVSESFLNYLVRIYEDNTYMMEPGRIENIVTGFGTMKCKIGIVKWEIIINGSLKEITSVAVFDENRNVRFDTELVNYFVPSESVKVNEDEKTPQFETDAIVSQASQTKSRTIGLQGTFGSVSLYYEARVTGIVSSYITASTNDAEYNYFTNHIICERRNESGIPPNAQPFLYFGTGGAYAILYNNSTPSRSPITITGGTNDRFNSGLYTVSGTNGLNWSFSFDFSVDFPGGGIGITPQSSISPLSLGAINNSSVNLLNYVYNHNVSIGDVRAVFFDGGSLTADNFRIITGSGAGETGKINITSKLRAGYLAPNIAGTVVPNFFSETSTAFNFSVQYLRGDYVLQPTFNLTSTSYNFPIGEIDTLKAKIINNSRAVKLNGGNISIDVSSLHNILTLLSSATLPIGSIDTSSSKEFKFVVRGNTNGIVTPQINISAMGWESPVPPSILINNITSIDSNIDVSPLIKTLTLKSPIQGFYNSSSNSMISDTVRVYLRHSTSPFAIADSAKGYLNSSGSGIFTFNNAVNFTQYFIQTKHRNAIETWSKTAQFFINSELDYDFSTSNTQAFGNNLTQVDYSPVYYAIFSGDVNQDGVVDASDYVEIDNDAANFETGYRNTDLNGDNFIDASDAVIADINAANFVSVIRP